MIAWTRRPFSVWLVALVILVAPAVAEDFALETVEGLPEGLSEAVQDVLSPQGHRVRKAGTPMADYWFRTELPLEGQSEGVFGIEMGAVTASALVGVVRFHDTWIDYRETDLAAGLYSLRYWIQPADGDHMGVSEYRDFLLVLSALEDQDPAQLYEKDPLLELSQRASERVHPAVVGVFPIWDEVEAPAALVMNEIDQWTLAVTIGDRVIGVVVEGHGELP